VPPLLQQRVLSKFSTGAEAQLQRQKLAMGQMQQAHEQAQEHTQQELAALKRERAAMCLGGCA